MFRHHVLKPFHLAFAAVVFFAAQPASAIAADRPGLPSPSQAPRPGGDGANGHDELPGFEDLQPELPDGTVNQPYPYLPIATPSTNQSWIPSWVAPVVTTVVVGTGLVVVAIAVSPAAAAVGATVIVITVLPSNGSAGQIALPCPSGDIQQCLTAACDDTGAITDDAEEAFVSLCAQRFISGDPQ